MKKKYLTTPEEILALKDTDTKIYTFSEEKYYKFVDGVLCLFGGNDSIELFNTNLAIGTYERPYILVEEPVKEADENDIGKLCEFWDGDFRGRCISTLECLQKSNHPYKAKYGAGWEHCRRLTPAEVAEITGYKVEE